MGMSKNEASLYTSAVQSAQQAQSAKTAADLEKAQKEAEKPSLTVDQVDKAVKKGNLTPNTLSAYEYYYGTHYFAANPDKLGDFAKDLIARRQNYMRETGNTSLTPTFKNTLTSAVRDNRITDAELDYILYFFNWG